MGEFHSSVNILEVCMVPPSPGSDVMTSLPLTFFDILLLRFPPVKCIYFYKSSMSFDVVVSNLKTSLSAILQHYLPLAGAIVWPEKAPKPVVETAVGDGVLMTIAESSSNFHGLVGDGLREAAEFHTLVPELVAVESRAAVVAFQVTSFGSTHGFCIGITSNHAVMDGRSATSFVKFWARACKCLVAGAGESPPKETMPFYDRSAVTDPTGLHAIYLRDWLAVGGPNNKSLKFLSLPTPHNLFRGTFKLNVGNIQKLKQFVLNRGNPAHISSFTVAMAYTWVCIAVADNSFKDSGKMVFCVLADARRRLDPPLPTNYFGNCIVERIFTMERAKLVVENGLVTAVEGISKAIKSLEDGEVLSGAEKWGTYLTQRLENNVKVVSPVGSPRFEIYGVDFGWGTPEKVEVVSIDGTVMVSVCDGRDGGIELGWVAKRDTMETFAAVFAKGLEEL